MPHFLTIKEPKNFINSLLHFTFNFILAISTILLTVLTGNPVLGLIFVFLSKWRMFAVHPYYWLPNLKANLADLIASASFVLLALPTSASASDFLPVHALLTLGYILWLAVLKPATSTEATEAQSLVTAFLGVNAATLLFSSHPPLLIFTIFIIIYSATRHLLIQSDDDHFTLLNLTIATLAAEITWLLHHWLIVYIFEGTGILLSQLAIVITLFLFCFSRLHTSWLRHDSRIKSQDTLAPILFSVIIITIMLLLFSKPIFNI